MSEETEGYLEEVEVEDARFTAPETLLRGDPITDKTDVYSFALSTLSAPFPSFPFPSPALHRHSNMDGGDEESALLRVCQPPISQGRVRHFTPSRNPRQLHAQALPSPTLFFPFLLPSSLLFIPPI